MAIGTQFSLLVIDLRAELRRPADVSVGVDDNDSLKRVLNSFYRTLLDDYDWPHLRHTFDKIPMVAGQRVYDYPTGFDPDNVEQAVIWQDGVNWPIKRRIELDNYSSFDPADDQRADPPMAWDVKFDITSGTSQIEIFPIPDSADYSIQFSGTYSPPKMVNDDDRCLLDDEIVVGFAAARLLKAQDSKDADIRLAQVDKHLLKKKAKPKGNAAPVQMGLGAYREDKGWQHPSIVIRSGSGS